MQPELFPAWRDYRVRQRLVAVVLASYLPIVHGLGHALRALAGTPTPENVLLSAWATACLAAVVWFASFRCPFCNEHFHWTLWETNPFSGRCLHCGFTKWRHPHAGRVFAEAGRYRGGRGPGPRA